MLDNCEQVARDAGVTLGSWLDRAPEAHFLVTSRARLKVRGEDVQTLEPLDPQLGIDLFMERARQQHPGFEADGDELAAVREVVGLAEGMPLAIELAAARVRVMTARQMVGRMRERLRILAGAGEDRHGSLRAAIEGSWELLAPWEQSAWAQCSVFEGGFTLEAVEQVVDLGRWAEAPWVVDSAASRGRRGKPRVVGWRCATFRPKAPRIAKIVPVGDR
jgi:predicted ATPase